MSKPAAKQKSQSQQIADEKRNADAALELARDLTNKIFIDSAVSFEDVCAVYDRMPLEDEEEAKAFEADLVEARDVARRLFGSGTVAAAVAVYDRRSGVGSDRELLEDIAESVE